MRLAKDGPIFTVMRVGAGSAILKSTSGKVRPAFTAYDKATGESKVVPAFEGGETVHVSVHAFVYPVEDEAAAG